MRNCVTSDTLFAILRNFLQLAHDTTNLNNATYILLLNPLFTEEYLLSNSIPQLH